jgi:hypothetical protein
MYSKEYERKMKNGLDSSFLSAACIVIALSAVVLALFGTLEALFRSNWIELRLLPTGVFLALLFFWLSELSQKWGKRNLEEAEEIARALLPQILNQGD